MTLESKSSQSLSNLDLRWHLKWMTGEATTLRSVCSTLVSKASFPALDACHWRMMLIFLYMTTVDNSFTPVSATKCPLSFTHCVSFLGSKISLLKLPYQNSTAQWLYCVTVLEDHGRDKAWSDFSQGLSPCSVGDCLPAVSSSSLSSVKHSSGVSPYSYKVISLNRFQPIHITSFHHNYIFTGLSSKTSHSEG